MPGAIAFYHIGLDDTLTMTDKQGNEMKCSCSTFYATRLDYRHNPSWIGSGFEEVTGIYLDHLSPARLVWDDGGEWVRID